jgi:DNA-binding YbaB/EbfC family protein
MRNIGGMMKRVQEMQEKMQEMTAEMEASRFDCSVGGGVVMAVVSGKGELVDLTISPEALDPDDTETLSDLIKLAVNNARADAELKKANALKELTGGLPLPPGMSLPF